MTFQANIWNDWKFNGANNTAVAASEVANIVLNNGTVSNAFRNGFKSEIKYSSPTEGQLPIIKLADDVTSWSVGDKIMIAATNFLATESEVFVIVDCPECGVNEVKLDRTAEFTHWGRIDPRTGVDQRAEVGLLSRNVRIYGLYDVIDRFI